MAASSTVPSSSSSSSCWSHLLPDLLGRVIAHLPFPGDRARLRAVCRAWRSAARHHILRQQLPWIVLPDGSFCTIGHDGAFFSRLPGGLPDNATCLGAAGDGWLALDLTDDALRRTDLRHRLVNRSFIWPRPGVKHRHSYLLHNPFSGETVPLPELDSIIGDVSEMFEIRKVVMRSDDLVAVATNNWRYNVILCRPGKGTCVLVDLRVFDVAFHGDRLYGITPEEELVAIDLAEDDQGRPTVVTVRRVIRRTLADGEEDRWSCLYDDDEDDSDHSIGGDDDRSSSAGSSNEEAEDNDVGSSSRNEEADHDVPDGEVSEHVDEPKAYMTTTRRLVARSSSWGDDEEQQLLMVRHHYGSPAFSRPYTRGVDIFKADMKQGKWVPVNNALAQGEALFLSRSLSKSTPAYGGIKEGSIYFADMDDVFDTKCGAPRPLRRPPHHSVADHLWTCSPGSSHHTYWWFS